MNDILTALVVVALVATLAVLLAGVVTMAKGGAFNRKWGNKLMRARIAMQALAVMLMFALFLLNRDWGD
ncbi:MAG: twin transmembrane helix small protein [Proteobacteria bacterium]|nr:twin transmembrane helix small protein [Pseudomonadota bacterium]